MDYAWLALAAPVALITRVITQEELLAEPRELLQTICRHCKTQLADESMSVSSKVRWWFLCKLAHLFTCGFCTSFWVGGAVSWLMFDYRLLYEGWRGTFLAMFVVMAVANVYMAAFSLLLVDIRKERAAADKAEAANKAG